MIGTLITLKAVVTNTPIDANFESPPKRVVNMGVVEADGIAA